MSAKKIKTRKNLKTNRKFLDNGRHLSKKLKV